MPYPPSATDAPPLSDRLDLLWLRATLAACADGPLPLVFGSTLHGALGRALKLTACALPDPATQPCAGCRLLDRCPYPRLFEPQHLPHGGSAPPPALLLAPSAATPRLLTTGTMLTIDLGLVGRGVHALPLLLVVLARMAEAGLGPGRVPCTVVRVDALDADEQPAAPVQIGTRMLGQAAAPIPVGAWMARAARAAAPAMLEIQVRSRMHLQREGASAAVPPRFADLVRALVRRGDALARAHGGEDAAFPDPRPWLAAADAVRLADARVVWQHQERRSARTGQVMPLDGLVGTLRYAGSADTLSAFLPLLYLGEAIGVGRGCSFGNGRYRVSVGEAPSTGT